MSSTSPSPPISVVDGCENSESIRSRTNSTSNISVDGDSGATLKPRQVIIWKDWNKSAQLLSVMGGEEEEMSMDFLDHEPLLVYAKVLHAYHCYDLIPTSSKLVVFDIKLSVKKAFLALIYNGVRAAPLWDSVKQCYIGMLTITDFIKILQRYYKEPGGDITELENHQIGTWREVLEEYNQPLIYVNPDATLFEAIQKLHQHHVHRLPVIDQTTGNSLFIITHKRLLRFLFIYIYDLPEPEFMHKSIAELNLGSYDNLATATPDMPVIEAINLFVERRISALPVIDSNRRVVNLYAKFDVINVAANKAYNDLSISIESSMKNRKEASAFEGVQTCRKTETLKAVMEQIAKAEDSIKPISFGASHPSGTSSMSCSNDSSIDASHSSNAVSNPSTVARIHFEHLKLGTTAEAIVACQRSDFLANTDSKQ